MELVIQFSLEIYFHFIHFICRYLLLYLGYFFKDTSFSIYVKKKTKKLIVSYLLWNIAYGLILKILNNLKIINYGNEFTLYNIFVAPFMTSSNQFHFNAAAWFLISIYFVQMIYFLVNKVNKVMHINTKYILLIFSTICAIISLKLVKEGYNYGIFYLTTRVSFLMPFYCLGQIYKRFEDYDKLNNIAYFIILIFVQAILIQKFTDITYNLNLLTFKHDYIIYMFSSITGIMFWIRIATILEKYIGDNKIVNYIGNNTYTIMMHHMFIFFLINIAFYHLNNFFGLFGNFSIYQFKRSVWYINNNNNPALSIFYCIIAISLPLIIKYFLVDKMLVELKEKLKESKNNNLCK